MGLLESTEFLEIPVSLDRDLQIVIYRIFNTSKLNNAEKKEDKANKKSK